ncbi:MAG: PIG-L family deacetylase [Chloroflexota bacterium]|nr:PIG-L family deacetylase [Chloroflexota bacterium]
MARILAIAAHPDDEIFGAGYLASRVAAGDELFLLCTTRGEGGEVGEPPVGPKSRLGEYRVVEMRNAAAALGARGVDFLDFVDPWMEIGGEALAIEASPREFRDAIVPHLGRLRPDVVVTHGSNGEYGHPQHAYTHRVVRAALTALRPWQPSELLTWCANPGGDQDDRLVNRDDRADFVLDITPWFDRKLAVVAAHRSQQAMFLRNNRTDRLEDVVRRTEAFRRWPLPETLDLSEVERPGGREVDRWR